MKSNKKKEKSSMLFNPNAVAGILAAALDKDLLDYEKYAIDPDTWNFNKTAQSFGSLKKFLPVSPSETREITIQDRNAFAKFCNISSHLDVVARNFEPPAQLSAYPFQGVCGVDAVLIKARNLCHQILDDFDYENVAMFCKHGPGSTVGHPYGSTHLTAKMEIPFTVTADALPVLRAYIEWDDTLKSELMYRYPEINFSDDAQIYKIVEGNSMGFAPKNSETSRIICTEPTGNAFVQQGIGAEISRCLANFGVDISTQQFKHKLLAFLSSVHRKSSTVDWTSASDTVLTIFCEWFFPSRVFLLMDKTRSKATKVPKELSLSGKVEYINPSTLSTMGNAFTFPVETLIFYCIAIATRSVNLNNNRSAFIDYEAFDYDVTVFGDDCIVPCEDFELFTLTLSTVGFIVNNEKSFSGDLVKFRESCGADYFCGRNVRPLFFKAPRSCKASVLRAWLYTLWNGIIYKLKTSFGSLTYVYQPVLAQLANLISTHNKEIFIVPDDFPEDSGLKFWGDMKRCERLFDARKFSPIICDVHGTVIFKFQKSNTYDTEVKCESMYYWQALKRIPKALYPAEFKNFEQGSEGCGYSQVVGTNCTDFKLQLEGYAKLRIKPQRRHNN
jgi:hypothetical protein